MRLFVDTNVFLDLLIRKNENLYSEEFFDRANYLNDEIYISAMSIRDIEYFVHKLSHNKELARESVLAIYDHINKIVNTSADAAISSIYSEERDFEDAMQMECAIENMCDAIITSNIKDYKNSSIPVLSPEEYLKYRKWWYIKEGIGNVFQNVSPIKMNHW